MRILIALVVIVAAVVALVLWLPSRGSPTVVEPEPTLIEPRYLPRRCR